ncbi:MAG TPA: hypothetical protein VM324_14495 [Egibacteraceae bacterium]|nr:hypothetical protein [Egibacteraceae bacterium]
MTQPFDRSLPSPIGAVLAVRSSAADSVVIAGQLSDRQQRVAVPTGVEDAILSEMEGGALRLVLISGSAGDGKSFTIGNLLARPGNPWEGRPERVIEDATHSERPDQQQVTRLREFFAPLERGAAPAGGPPLLIAMNTGMVIRFVADLRETDPGAYTRLADLAEVLLGALGVPHRSVRTPDPAYAASILVANLDERPTTGASATLFRGILRSFDPGDPAGLLEGAPRCDTCRVRPWCWVRTNAEILSAEQPSAALDTMVDRLALERGRPLAPRALWDAAAAITLGGAEFSEPDPCDRIAKVAMLPGPEALSEVWLRVLPNSVFEAPVDHGLASLLRDRDTTFAADGATHDVVAEAGIDAGADAAALERHLGGPSRDAIALIAAAVRSGELAAALRSGWRRSICRALARAAVLAGDLAPADPELAGFAELLEEYASGDFGERVAALEELAGEALARSFGEEVRSETYFRTGNEADRDVAVHVRVDMRAGETHEVLDDPVVQRNPRGARVVGYRPLAIELGIAADTERKDISLTVNYSLYRVLRDATRGVLPSAAALERFYSLRRAAAALGAHAARDHSQPLLLADRRTGRRVRLELHERRGNRRYRDQEVL